MEDETKRLLKENLEVSQSNNQLLRKLVRASRWGLILSSIKWIIVIGSALGIYYFLGPQLESLLQVYQDLLSGANASGSSLVDLLQGFR